MKKEFAPETFAVIDIGSHAVRLGIFQVEGSKKYEVLEELAYPLLLGSDVFHKGKISQKNIHKVCSILAEFAKRIKEYAVHDSNVRTFATSAVREASNNSVFISRIEMDTGLQLKILEPSEEIKQTFLAVKENLDRRIKFTEQDSIICNIGTGSTQFAVVEGGNVVKMMTLRFGTLRIMEMLKDANLGRSLFNKALDHFIDNLVDMISRVGKRRGNSALFVVTGGNARSLINIAFKGRKVVSYASINRKKLAQIETILDSENISDIVEHYSVSDYYAYGLKACCVFIEKLIEYSSAEKVVIASIDTKNIVLKDMIRESIGSRDSFGKNMLRSAEYLGEQYMYDRFHAKVVRDNSVILFDALQEKHKFGEKEKLILQIASILHDIGQFIAISKHHKHSYYLISNSVLPGVSSEEMEIIAQIARYHRKSLPKKSHNEYSVLSDYDRLRVSALSAILRIADALDRLHDAKVEIVSAEVDGNTLNISIKSSKNISIELFALKIKQDLFQEFFCMKVNVIEV